jgi:hypothetical protein
MTDLSKAKTWDVLENAKVSLMGTARSVANAGPRAGVREADGPVANQPEIRRHALSVLTKGMMRMRLPSAL